MTGEELDRARSIEALRIVTDGDRCLNWQAATVTAARLAREGWMPPDPLEAEVDAVLREYGYQSWAADKPSPGYQMVRAVMDRGIEIGRTAPDRSDG